MKRVALILVAFAALAVVGTPALADHRYHHGHGGVYINYAMPRVVAAPVYAYPAYPPAAVYPAPAAVYPSPVYSAPPAYYYGTPAYYPAPGAYLQYRSRGLSIGLGF
jgi:hypothetical protein